MAFCTGPGFCARAQGLLLTWRKVRYGLPARAGLSLRRKPLDQKETRTPCQP